MRHFTILLGCGLGLMVGCARSAQTVDVAPDGPSLQPEPTATTQPIHLSATPVVNQPTATAPVATRPVITQPTTVPATLPATAPSTVPSTLPATQPGDKVADLIDLKQDVGFYVSRLGLSRQTISAEVQKQMDRDQTEKLFAPWHRSKASEPKAKLVARFTAFEAKPGYGENYRRHDASWLKGLRDNANLNVYPSVAQKAITVANSDLRELPTERPHFDGVNHPWEAFPFDNLQSSSLVANTPVLITHVTRDKAWFLVETPIGTGWLPVRDVAYADKNFIRKWEIGQYIVITLNDVPIVDQQGFYRFHASIGHIFPKAGESAENFGIRVAVADEQRSALIMLATIRKTGSSAKPLTLTGLNLARVADELMEEPYGWGGMYGRRDCSSMLRDLFTPFGFWLPRNSYDQARHAGTFIDLSALSAEQREQKIIAEGVPFLTLIKAKEPNHVMLYIGTFEGKPLVFHNFWGIRTKTAGGEEGRLVVGRSAITTLRPGRERPDVNPEGTILHRIEGMTILGRWMGAATSPSTKTQPTQPATVTATTQPATTRSGK